tara:strand:+ start:3886 stop:6258 length:2373 start_codon:yes stop_codon:yes gene_type:complete
MKKILLIILLALPLFGGAQGNCTGLDSVWVTQTCDPNGGTILYYNWTVNSFNPNCVINTMNFGNSNNNYVFPYSSNNGIWGVYATTNPNIPPDWNEEFYWFVEFTDGTMSDTIFHTPYACILGCSDPASVAYNPWANTDDGSCGATGATCDPWDREIIVEITLDNWPSETSWTVISLSDGNSVIDISQGDYDFSDIGNTYTYNLCVDTLGFEFIIHDTYGDGLAGTTSGGSLDGDVVIYDCNGNVLWDLADPDFNYVAYSGALFGNPCNGSIDVPGCTDPSFQEYDSLATIDDGSCVNPHVYGCIDTNAYNYNANATIMDIVSTCDYTLWIGDAAADGWGDSYIGLSQGSNLWTFTMAPGDYSETHQITLDTDKPIEVYYFEVGSSQTPPQEVEFQTWQNSFKLTNTDGVILMHEGSNPFANNGQGALQPFEPPFYSTYSAVPFCGNLCVPKVFGCMDSLSYNYNPLANTDDGNCVPVVYGCTNDLAFNYNPLANTDDGTCQSIITGCMDPDADNYNSLANTEDGSCYYIGCTDPAALNYDSTATVNSGCIYPIPGCTDPTAFNYNPLANVDDSSCVPVVYGCMDITAFNYDPLANVDNNSCIAVVFGCIDSTALNYNPLANTDNGTCILPIVGCTDPNAYNYDPTANVTDSLACLYDAGCYGGPGVPYWLNDGCYAWVIDVDDYCCTTDWDASCQSMYNYCENGWPAGLNDTDALGIIVYPNPTHDMLLIDTHLTIGVKVLDMMGKEVPVIEEDGYNTTRINLSKLSEGAYTLVITHNDKRYTKRVIKQ